MKKGDLLFVYGSLRKGEKADLSNNMMATFVGNDRINGLLYGISWFPGAKDVPNIDDYPRCDCGDCDGHDHTVLGGKINVVDFPSFNPSQPAIIGNVFRLRHLSIIGQLDGYEGYPDLYERYQTVSEEGRTVWVYIYNHGVTDDQLVPNGDWCPPGPVIRASAA